MAAPRTTRSSGTALPKCWCDEPSAEAGNDHGLNLVVHGILYACHRPGVTITSAMWLQLLAKLSACIYACIFALWQMSPPCCISLHKVLHNVTCLKESLLISCCLCGHRFEAQPSPCASLTIMSTNEAASRGLQTPVLLFWSE